MTYHPNMQEMTRTITMNHRWETQDDPRQLSYSNDHIKLAFELLHRDLKGNLYDNDHVNVILCIKTLRSQTDMGLLEAKCAIEFARDMIAHLRHTRLVALVNPLTYANR